MVLACHVEPQPSTMLREPSFLDEDQGQTDPMTLGYIIPYSWVCGAGQKEASFNLSSH